MSTDKVDSEVPSPVSGTLTEILVEEGDTVDVGAVLARVGDAPAGGGEAPAEQAEAPEAPAEQAPAPEAPAPEQPAPEEPAPEEPAPAPAAEARARPGAARTCAGQPRPGARAGPASQGAPATNGAPASNGGRLLSPVVRRLITEHGLDPAAISGTGPGGRITRNDVLAVLDKGGSQAPAAPAAPARPAAPAQPAAAPQAAAPAAPAPAPAAPQPVARAGERDTTVPLTNIRRRTAEHMVRSKATSAHVYASIEVDFEGVERVRRGRRRTRSRRPRASASPTCRSSAGPSSTPSASSPR